MMNYRQLGHTGMKLSILGMGGSGFGAVYGKYNESEAIDAVHYSIDKGINFFDTAYWYGQGKSESFLGRALKGVPREKYYIATKVGRYERDTLNMFDFSASKTLESARQSLERLQLDYVDLLQVHDVEFAPSVDTIVKETLPALEELKRQGVCRFIGITGYSLSDLLEVARLSTVKIDSVLTYCRLTLNDSSLLSYTKEFDKLGISLINASAVSMGLLTTTPVQNWHPATVEIREACDKAVQYCQDHDVDITKLATNYTGSFPQAATTLISMHTRSLVDQNMAAMLSPLTAKEQEVREHILSKFFAPLPQQHWEHVEVIDYWKQIAQHWRQEAAAGGSR